ncbi:MAG: FHA domain-containing protein [Pseudomonadota bacterium]
MKTNRTGPQGTTLFRTEELADVIASPSADSEGDIGHAALLGVSPPFLDQRFILRHGRTTIGRREDNDIVLPDGSVSSQHAWILNENGLCRVMNILSTNGTFINDIKVHEAPLNEGDRIRFGQAEFLFRAGMTAPPSHDRLIPLWVWIVAVTVTALAATAFMLA